LKTSFIHVLKSQNLILRSYVIEKKRQCGESIVEFFQLYQRSNPNDFNFNISCLTIEILKQYFYSQARNKILLFLYFSCILRCIHSFYFSSYFIFLSCFQCVGKDSIALICNIVLFYYVFIDILKFIFIEKHFNSSKSFDIVEIL